MAQFWTIQVSSCLPEDWRGGVVLPKTLAAALIALATTACSAPVSPSCTGACNPSGFWGYDVEPSIVAKSSTQVCFGSVSITSDMPTCDGAWAARDTDGSYTFQTNQSFSFAVFVSNPRARGRTLTYDLTLTGACAKDSSPHHISFDEHERPVMGGFAAGVWGFVPDVCTFHFTGTETGGNLAAPTVLDREVVVRVVK
jgi:hypothetical protein